jgi:hypothetical protein
VASSQASDLGVLVLLRPYGNDFWEYEGTRAQIEAEGIVPEGSQWPTAEQGAAEVQWEERGLRFSLRRTRPDGMKGPMSLWLRGDWWRLRCDRGEYRSGFEIRADRLRRELAQLEYENSREGQQARFIAFKRIMAAKEDAAFQALLVGVLPERKKPGKKPGVALKGGEA